MNHQTYVLAESSTAGELQGWSFSIEQDLFYLIDIDKNEDRDYTIGIDVGICGVAVSSFLSLTDLEVVVSVLGLSGTSKYHDKQRIVPMGVKVYALDKLSNPRSI